MVERWYAAVAIVLTLAFLGLAADRAGLVRMPWQPAPEASLKTALLRSTWTIDLETGEQASPQADLHWGMAARDQPYLGTYQRRSGRGALIAETGGRSWEELDEAALAKLNYAPNRYSAWGPDAPVRDGAVFGVRTVEGNLAKVRVAGIGTGNRLRLEWLLYPGQTKVAEPAPKSAPSSASSSAPSPGASPGPSLAWRAARDDALAAYRAQRYQEALDACGGAVAAAAQAGAEHHALALVTCGGLIGLHRRAARQTEEWLRQGVATAMKLEQRAIVAALGPGEAMLKERGLRMLGVLYRDQNRLREAAEQFALAVDTVRAMPPPETAEHRLALRSDLQDLGAALAQLGLRGTARQALQESREYYLKTEPNHPALKAIDEQLRRLDEPVRD